MVRADCIDPWPVGEAIRMYLPIIIVFEAEIISEDSLEQEEDGENPHHVVVFAAIVK